MPFDTSSRQTPVLRTLADLRSWVQTHYSYLPGCEVRTQKNTAPRSVVERQETRRRDAISAIDRISGWLGQPPEALSIDGEYLAGRLASVRGVLHGLTEKTVANAFAALRGAVAAAHANLPPRERGLDPAWRALRDLLPAKFKLRWRLSRFSRYCAQHGIPPEAVVTATFLMFLAWMKMSLVKTPRQIVRDAAKAWIEAAATVPGWPQQPVACPSFAKPRTTIPLGQFPESFQADFRRCAERLQSEDPFLDSGRNRPLKPSTAEKWMEYLLYAASVLVRLGRPIESITCVADVVAPAAARDVLRYYFQKAGNRPTKFTSNLAYVLKRIAQLHVGIDDETLQLHRDNFKKMSPAEDGLTEKNMKRLRPFNNDRCKLLLFEAPDRLIERALPDENRTRKRHVGRRKAKVGKKRGAIDLLVAAAVAIELFAPVRLGNLVEIDLDRHLRLPARENEPGYLHFEPHEVKNNAALDFELPPDAVRAIRLYIEHGRARLMDAAASDLFPYRTLKTPRARANYISTLIARRIWDVTGLRINTHLFRHIAAKFYLDEHPGDYETVRILLGHKCIETTIKFYCGLERAAAIRAYDREVLKLRDKLEAEAAKKAPRRRPNRRRDRKDDNHVLPHPEDPV